MVILLVVLVLGETGGNSGGANMTLEFWGVFDDKSDFESIIDAYETVNKNIKIVYRQFPVVGYEDAVINAISEGKAPDIWMIHNTWLPKYKDKLLPFPQPASPKQKGYRINNFRDDFVDVALFDFTDGQNIYAFPLYVDTLALYYNKDYLNSNGFVNPPKTWNEFVNVAKAITRADNFSKRIERSGAAIGTSRNINRSTDILSLLMLQSGVQMTDRNFSSVRFAQAVDELAVSERALSFYTSFADPNSSVFTWNDQQPYSIDAFVDGKTAMMINYSHHMATIRAKAPRLNFAVASVPQMSQSNAVLNYASYFGLAVPKINNPQRQLEAWKFIAFATSEDSGRLYTNATARPPARRALVEELQNDLNLGVFARQAVTARSWYQIDSAAIEKIFADMIDNVNFGVTSVSQALSDAETKVNVLMRGRSRK